MLDKHDKLVVTVHTNEDPRSPYIKITIEDNLEQLASFLLSVLEAPLVRFFDKYQDELVVEYKKYTFNYPAVRNLAREINKITEHAEQVLFKAKERSLVRIHNFWMAEEYNNLDMAIKIIQKHGIPVHYNQWKDAAGY